MRRKIRSRHHNYWLYRKPIQRSDINKRWILEARNSQHQHKIPCRSWLSGSDYLRGQDIEDLQYDLHEFASSDVDGVQDFTDSQLKEMQEEILKQGTLTQK